MKIDTLINNVLNEFSLILKEYKFPNVSIFDEVISYYGDEFEEIVVSLFEDTDYPSNIVYESELIADYITDKYGY